MMTLSSSDTEEGLKLLFLSPPCIPVSHVSKPFSRSGSYQFKDWPEANDMAMSAEVALIADALSSRASTVSTPRGGRKSCVDGSSTPRGG
jgi:hypothetical protein